MNQSEKDSIQAQASSETLRQSDMPSKLSSISLRAKNDFIDSTPDEVWRYLESGLNRIMAKPEEKLDMKTYMALHAAIVKFTSGKFATPKEKEKETNVRSQDRDVHVRGEDLYRRLETFLERQVQHVHSEIFKHTGDSLLTAYMEHWKRFITATKQNDHLFQWMNRHWIKRILDEGKEGYFVEQLHLMKWRQHVLPNDSDAGANAILQACAEAAEKQSTAEATIDSVVRSFLIVGTLKEEETSIQSLCNYLSIATEEREELSPKPYVPWTERRKLQEAKAKGRQAEIS